jgi:hypothetical protein
MENKTYCFQFATERSQILENTDLITLVEAKRLWKENYSKAIKYIQNGTGVQMYIWKDMKDEEDFREILIKIDNDFVTDGVFIYPPVTEPVPIDL